MGTVSGVIDYPEDGVFRAKWEGLNVTNPIGRPIQGARYVNKSVHIFGTFGAGGTVVIRGSMVTATGSAVTLRNESGTSLSVTKAQLEKIQQNPLYIFPHATVTSGTTDIDVIIIGRKETR